MPEDESMADFLCALIRGDSVNWPSSFNTGFYDSLLGEARNHGVDALVCHLLKPMDCWDELPEPFKNGLLQSLRGSAVTELIRARDLVDLQAAFDQAGISALLLKGSALAYTHYAEPYLRTRADTDIFINLADIKQVRRVFREQGYEFRGWIYKSHQFDCFKPDFGGGAINYDVHWRSNNSPEFARVISHSEAWEESVQIPELAAWHTLKPQLALLQACIHWAGNPGEFADRLNWLYDIHLLISDMSESELLEFAQKAVNQNMQGVSLEAFAKTCSAFQTIIPDNVIQVLSAPTKTNSLRQRFSKSQLALILDDLIKIPGLVNKLDLIREFLFPPGEYLLSRYEKSGRWWIPILYFRYVILGLFERVTLR